MIINNINQNCYLLHFITNLLIVFLLLIIIVVFCFDSIIRKRYSDLKYKDELFNTISTNTDNVFWIYDVKLKEFEYVSQNFNKTLEISKSILTRGCIKLLEFFPCNIREKITQMYLSGGKCKKLEEVFEYTKPISKSKCWMMLRIYPVYKHKKAIRLICIATDISEEKQTQLALEEVLLSVKKSNQAKKDFLSHIGHELKTPISAIIGLNAIASNSLNDINKSKDYLSRIDLTSRKLLSIINNILDMSRIDSNKLVLDKKPFYMSTTLQNFSSIINGQIALNNLEYSLIINSIPDDFLLGDSLRTIQILGNCISNSIKYTPAGGNIKLEVTEIKRNDDKALFQFIISDTGIGMSEEFLDHLFSPFEQEDSSSSWEYGSTGIGMTITKGLLDLMGGTIQVVSEVDCGTTITIQIEYLINQETSSSKELKMEKTELSHYDFQGKRILVVEDNEINRMVLYEMFSLMNLNVTTASGGYEAIKLFESSDKGYYDIILMDVRMPGLDGYKTSELIRASKHPDAKTVCLITLTADDFAEVQTSLNYGVDHHITKPINIDYFYSLVMNGEKNN